MHLRLNLMHLMVYFPTCCIFLMSLRKCLQKHIKKVAGSMFCLLHLKPKTILMAVLGKECYSDAIRTARSYWTNFTTVMMKVTQPWACAVRLDDGWDEAPLGFALSLYVCFMPRSLSDVFFPQQLSTNGTFPYFFALVALTRLGLGRFP